MKAYLISLEGMGDTTAALVSKDIFEWIERKDTPGRTGDESGWIDTGVPAVLLEALKKESHFEEPFVTSGSFDNDRALIAAGSSAVIHSSLDTDDAEKEVKDWARENGFEIVDTYVGGIY